MRARFIGEAVVTVALGLWCALVSAQADAPAKTGIYTCVDSKGRKLSADRPIPDCMDREQKMLSPSGTVSGRIGPALTAKEQEALDAKAQQEAREQNRQMDEKRRNRALITRYPTRALHDAERAQSLTHVDSSIKAAQSRVEELNIHRGKLDVEMEFYQKDPSKAPASLRRQLTEIEHNTAAQRRFIAEQELERARVNARFDEELARLRTLWAAQTPASQ